MASEPPSAPRPADNATQAASSAKRRGRRSVAAAAAVPALEGVLELLAGEEGISGGNRRNREFAAAFTEYREDVDEARRALLCDPMTSGGLLVAVAAELAPEMEQALGAAAPGTSAIGVLEAGEAGAISVG